MRCDDSLDEEFAFSPSFNITHSMANQIEKLLLPHSEDRLCDLFFSPEDAYLDRGICSSRLDTERGLKEFFSSAYRWVQSTF